VASPLRNTMPIRFRCVYCDKLLGIARRKAGAVVNCPQCGQPLIVPTPEPEPEKVAAAPPAPASVPAGAPNKLFERDDFDVVLQGDVTVQTHDDIPASPPAPKRSKPRQAAPPPVPSPLPPRPFAVEQSLPAAYEPAPAPLPLPARRQERGMVLTTGKLIGAVVAVLVLVLGAFGGGVVVGRMLASGGNG
jgi:hypothetical protein